MFVSRNFLARGPLRAARACVGLGLVWLLPLGSVGCRETERARRVEPKAAPASAAEIVAQPLGGELAGRRFSVQSARYTIDRRHGYEKTDISLSSARTETPCGARTPADAPSVWLRRTGSGALEADLVRVGTGAAGPWQVHYELRDGHRWLGNSEASALIVMHGIGPDLKLVGELWACFSDTAGSCVAGRFTADYCPIRIDEPVRGTDLAAGRERPDLAQPVVPPSSAKGVSVEPRTALLAAFPCSRCHKDRAPRPERRRLTEFHQLRAETFSHGENELWCYQCHSLRDIDRLRMASDELASFDEAFRICTSCHGDKLDDWNDGIHGLTAGFWNGAKFRRSCPACHDPHRPKFPTLVPEKRPAPPRPRTSSAGGKPS